MRKYYIKKSDWEAIYQFLTTIKRIRIKNQFLTRKFIESVYFIMRTGSQWRELPSYYGKWRSVHKRYEDWCTKDLWSNILNHFTQDHDGENIMIDSTIIRAHPCSAGYKKDSAEAECLGRSKGGFTTKIHAVVDGLGQALRFKLTGGNRNDITQACELIAGFEASNIIVDKAYDSNRLLEQIENQGCEAIIPPRRNRKILRDFDKDLYKERHLIECFFGKIKHFRRVFARFD